ncbi:MAG: GTP cyclohydrolase [Burkholderiales bacterium]|nr:GTP cyclohydrolase [Burkholderiales bacterium]
MFIIQLRYLKPLSEVDRLVGEHRVFLERHYASGHFLMSGRKEPRTGGVILAQAGSLAELEAIVQQDPFYREQIAEYELIEFLPSMTAASLAQFKV